MDYSASAIDAYVYYSYDAVYAFAHAAQIMLDDGKTTFAGEDMVAALSQVSFPGVTGEVNFKPNGDRKAGVGYSFINYADTSMTGVALGDWTAATSFVYNDGQSPDSITWPTASGERPVAVIEVDASSSSSVGLEVVGGVVAFALLVIALLVANSKKEKAKLVMLMEEVKLLQEYSKAEVDMLEDKILSFEVDVKAIEEHGGGAEKGPNGTERQGMKRLIISASELVGKEVIGKGR